MCLFCSRQLQGTVHRDEQAISVHSASIGQQKIESTHILPAFSFVCSIYPSQAQRVFSSQLTWGRTSLTGTYKGLPHQLSQILSSWKSIFTITILYYHPLCFRISAALCLYSISKFIVFSLFFVVKHHWSYLLVTLVCACIIFLVCIYFCFDLYYFLSSDPFVLAVFFFFLSAHFTWAIFSYLITSLRSNIRLFI